MKTFLLSLCIALLPLFSFGQKVEKKFIDKLCECSQKIDANQEVSALKKEVRHCVDVATAVNREELKKEYANLSDEEISKRTDAMVMKTAKDCPAFNKLYLKLERETNDNEDRSGQKHNVPAECNQMHDGTFRYVGMNDDGKVFISRKGNLQYEGKDGDPYYVHSRIEWIDECTYMATFWETNDPKLQSLYKKGQSITVTITSVDGANYSYFTNLGGAKINAKMTKVSEEFIDLGKKK